MGLLSSIVVFSLVGLLAAIAPAAPPAAVSPPLGVATSFAVLGGSTVTNTGLTVVTGDLGVSPGTAITGFGGPPDGTVSGTIHANDAVAQQAQADATTAYNNLAGQACDTVLTGVDLGGLTLVPGVYCFSSSAQLTGALTLDAQGDPTAVWVFQIGSTLTTASSSSVNIINGGIPCNVWWQVGSSATLGTDTAFTGNVLALASITLNTDASLEGRALAQTAAVTMDTNAITILNCASLGVQVSDFQAGCQAGIPVVQWETVHELDIVGFNLWRSTEETAPRTLLAFIAAQAPGSTQGHSYTFDDTSAQPGGSYWYWLEVVDTGGGTTEYGPVTVTCSVPTAVALSDFAAGSGGSLPLSQSTVVLAILAVLVLGASVVSRRRKLA